MPFRIKLTITVLISVLAALVIVPLVLPIGELADTVPERELARSDSAFVRIGELDVHVLEQGSGEPAIILLHGFGASVLNWEDVRRPLSELGRTVAFDRPGFGLTSRPLEWEGVNPYGMDGQLALLDDLMTALDVEAAILVGHSAGGTLAAKFALERPERTLGLVLSSPAIHESGGPPAWARPLLHTPQMNRLGPLVMRQFAGEPGEGLIRSAWSDPSRISLEVLERYRVPLRAENWDYALWELTKASRPTFVSGRLASLAVPTLVITGADDEIVPVEHSRAVAAGIPDARLEILPACGHVAHEECPTKFLAAVSPFIENAAKDAAAAP